MNLDAPCHVGETSRSRSMTYLLSRCIALAENLFATRVDRTVSRLVPYLKQTPRLNVPSISVRVTIGLARRRALHVTVRVINSCPLELLRF